MVCRTRHLLNDSIQASDNTTFSFNLPENGALHGLLVRVAATNGATAGRNVGPLTIVDTLRVVGNGDERFFELNAVELEKWHETFQGVGLDMEHDEAAAAVQYVTYPIMWGRVPYDPEYFLPLDRIKNPRLEVVYSPTIAADGGFATGTTTINIIAIWSPTQDRLPYAGTLITRTVKAFTSAASGDEETDIEISDPIRAIGIYAFESLIADGVDVTRVRLEANSGEFDLWAGDWDDLQQLDRQMFYDRIVHDFKLLAQDTDVLDTRLGDPRAWSLHCGTASSIANDTFVIAQFTTIAGDRLTMNIGEADITAGAETYVTDTVDKIYYVTVEGRSPSYFGLIPYLLQDNARGYLNPREFDKLKLILTQGGAGADVRIGLQYLKNVQLVG